MCGIFGFAKRENVHDYDKMKNALNAEIEKFFRPEFINRLDETIVFRPLIKDDLNHIIEIELDKVRQRLNDKGIELVLNEASKRKSSSAAGFNSQKERVYGDDSYNLMGKLPSQQYVLQKLLLGKAVSSAEVASFTDVGFPYEYGGLAATEVTIAEVLEKAGYATAFYGKSHLGDVEQSYMTNQGFDDALWTPYNQVPSLYVPRGQRAV